MDLFRGHKKLTVNRHCALTCGKLFESAIQPVIWSIWIQELIKLFDKRDLSSSEQRDVVVVIIAVLFS